MKNNIVSTITSLIVIIILTLLIFIIGNAYDEKVKRDTEYGVEDILKIDTINIHNLKHEVLLINKNGKEKIIHSPKCKCNEK